MHLFAAILFAALPSLSWGTVTASWDGQAPSGLAVVSVRGLATEPAGIVLTDSVGGVWTWGKTPSDPGQRPVLGYARDADGTTRLSVLPSRAEPGATVTVVAYAADGSASAARCLAGPSTFATVGPQPDGTSTSLKPGDDVQAAVDKFSSVHLAKGAYVLTSPLVISRPCRLEGDYGAVLAFRQPAGQEWTTAVRVKASHVTLYNLFIRFIGSVNWDLTVPYGPAVLGGPDQTDPTTSDPLVDFRASVVNLAAPDPVPGWTESPRSIRLYRIGNGSVELCALSAGSVEWMGGPWRFYGNIHFGPPSKTFTYAAFAGHWTHDVEISRNRIDAAPAGAKTWRFLVLTEQSVNVSVHDNVANLIGPMDGDSVTNPNASEIMLTEAYHCHWEGDVASVSADGRAVEVGPTLGNPYRSGDIFAVLSGPGAGTWRRVDQVLGPTAILVSGDPLPPAPFAASVSTGFISTHFDHNTFDLRGSSQSSPFVFVGAHADLRVSDNVSFGGGQPFKITACASEPEGSAKWGWTRMPNLGAVVRGNRWDSYRIYGWLACEEDPAAAPVTPGRTYLTAKFTDNVGRGNAGPFAVIGDDRSKEPGACRVWAANDTPFRASVATITGQKGN